MDRCIKNAGDVRGGALTGNANLYLLFCAEDAVFVPENTNKVIAG